MLWNFDWGHEFEEMRVLEHASCKSDGIERDAKNSMDFSTKMSKMIKRRVTYPGYDESIGVRVATAGIPTKYSRSDKLCNAHTLLLTFSR